jgi:hypothetical protein
MWSFRIANSLNGYDMLAIKAGKRSQASIDTCMVDLLGGRIVLTDNNCTSTATTLSAATGGKQSVELPDKLLRGRMNDKRIVLTA